MYIRSTTNEVPNCRSPERALLRHSIIGVRLPTSARARENAKICSAQSKNAREYWQQPTISSEDNYAKNDKWHCFRMHHVMHAITSSDGG